MELNEDSHSETPDSLQQNKPRYGRRNWYQPIEFREPLEQTDQPCHMSLLESVPQTDRHKSPRRRPRSPSGGYPFEYDNVHS